MPKRNNWRIVVGCICIATVFWLFNALQQDYTTYMAYPITFTLPASRSNLKKKLPTTIALEVNNTGWTLLKHMMGKHKKPVVFTITTRTRVITARTIRLRIKKQLKGLKILKVRAKPIYL